MSKSGFKIEVSGIDGVQRTLRQLADIDEIIDAECAERIQEIMRADAVRNLSDSYAVDTGILRRSVETDDGYNSFTETASDTEKSVGIRTDVSHAIFIEYGTGIRGDPDVPHKKIESWVYPTGNAKTPYKTAHAQNPRPFMRPALYENRFAFAKIVAESIRRTIDGD